MKDNPYVGPRAYRREDGRYFFGREREARELRSLIQAQREVLFYAQSGAGKTSLLNARVIPDLEDEGFCVLPVARVGAGAPPSVIDLAEVKNIFVFGALLSVAGEGADPRPLLGHTLASYLQEEYPLEEDTLESRPRVLILDQFEEIVTAHRARWDDAEGFFKQVRDALDDLPDLGVVLSMREDYVAAVDPFTVWFPRRLRSRFRMERLGFKAALDAIKRPAEEAGCPFDNGVAERLVDDLRRLKVQPHSGAGEETVLGPFIETVQLQVVCSRLWEDARRYSAEVISDRYVSSSLIDQALIDFYEAAIKEAARETKISQQSLRDWVQQELITEAGTRGTAFRGDQSTGEIPSRAADILVDKYLLRTEVRAGGTWYELIHDRFVEPILESNRRIEDPLSYLKGGGVNEIAGGITAISRVLLDAIRDVAMTLDSWGQANLEVRTYTSRDPGNVTVDPKSGELLEADLQALTSVGLDGDSSVMLPLDEGGAIDGGLLEIHQALVDQALTSRTEFLHKLVQIADSMEQFLARGKG